MKPELLIIGSVERADQEGFYAFFSKYVSQPERKNVSMKLLNRYGHRFRGLQSGYIPPQMHKIRRQKMEGGNVSVGLLQCRFTALHSMTDGTFYAPPSV